MMLDPDGETAADIPLELAYTFSMHMQEDRRHGDLGVRGPHTSRLSNFSLDYNDIQVYTRNMEREVGNRALI